MGQTYNKTCSYALLTAILVTGMVAIATNNSFVLAQPCSAQLGSPNVYAQQYESEFEVTVPVSAACSSYTGPLYAIGTAYDNDANIGTTNTLLNPTYDGSGFSGQLSFTLPISIQYDSLQLSASIYSTQNGYVGSPLATTSSTYAFGYSYYPYYSYYPSYPYYWNYPSYSSSSNYPSYQHNSGWSSYYSSGSSQHSGSSNQHYSGWSSHYSSGSNQHYSSGSSHYSSSNQHYSGWSSQHSNGSSHYSSGSSQYSGSNNENNNGHHTHP